MTFSAVPRAPARDSGVPARDVAKGPAMTDNPSRAPMAGGFLIAACLMLGTLLGAVFGQTSAGLVGGAGVGIALAVVVWLRDRR